MKKIHLIRHAKSSWDNGSLADIDRPLNDRGISTCYFMAQHIYDAGCGFDNVFCSPALRAQSTIELISQCLTETDFQWQTENELYTFNSDHLITWLRAVDQSIAEVLIIGHNPALTELCNELSNSDVTNIPTCGYVQLVTDQDCVWDDIAEAAFELAVLLKPKELK